MRKNEIPYGWKENDARPLQEGQSIMVILNDKRMIGVATYPSMNGYRIQFGDCVRFINSSTTIYTYNSCKK